MNSEWRLSDFLDSLTAEVERSQDTLSLKSFGRGMSMAVQGLTLELGVQVRVDEKGQVFFRSAEPGETAATHLKIDLREAFQSQLEEVRRPVEEEGLGLPLSALPGVTAQEIDALHALSVYTVEDLKRFARTPALLSELSRKTGIPDPSLRSWLGLPFLSRLTPPAGWPGQTVEIEGGNLGEKTDDDTVFFQSAEAKITAWQATKIVVEIPAGAASGPVYARIDGARSNVLLWEERPAPPAAKTELEVTALTLEPAAPADGEAVRFSATLVHRAGPPTGPFAIEWGLDGARLQLVQDPGLSAGQSRSLEIRQNLAAGPHRIRFAADPEARLTVTDRARIATEKSFVVAPRVPPPPAGGLAVTSVIPDRSRSGIIVTVTVLGRGFQPGVTASFGRGITLQMDRTSSERLAMNLTLPPRIQGLRALTITNPDGTSITVPDAFRILAPGEEGGG